VTKLAWLIWMGTLAAVTAAMLAVRPNLEKAHVALAYLLLVLIASARAGRTLGIALSVLSFVCLNFFFVPPFHSLVVMHPLDWLVLAAFLVTGIVASQLLARAQDEATIARDRAVEVDRLSALGAEALNAPRPAAALVTIAEVIRSTLQVARCEIFVRDAAGAVSLAAHAGQPVAPGESRLALRAQLVDWVAASGRSVAERLDGSTRVSVEEGHLNGLLGLDAANARTIVLPLRVRDRTVGVLRLDHTAAIPLDLPRSRFLVALLYYASLGVERLRLTDEAEHAQALREADELKDALLASVSHDLRTPLTTIKALAHDLRVEGHERAATIEEEADRLNRFVADLLDLSRLDGGAFRVAPEINAAEDLIGVALQRVAGMLRGHEVRVALDTTEPLLLGRFDLAHSVRIVVNLIENAAKYSPVGSTIDLRVERSGDELLIEVADRGPGVPPGEEQRIFEPFYRPSGSASDVGSAGLGLSIARRMAEAQGGAVRYEPREGGGSMFVLRLPAADTAALESL
jgi:two-component system, OmpR family, sensor histidine kinase KdpD